MRVSAEQRRKTERRRRLLAKPQPYDQQLASVKALTNEMTDSLVTHFTKPYMDRANRLVNELGAAGDEAFTNAVGESGTVAMHLRELFEGIVKPVYDQLDLFDRAVKADRSRVGKAKEDLKAAIYNAAAQMRRAISATAKHDSLISTAGGTVAADLIEEGKLRVAMWSRDVSMIVLTWQAYHF